MATQDSDPNPTAEDGPLLIEGPKGASADTPIIDLEPLHADAGERIAGDDGSESAAPENTPPRWLPANAPLAAAIVFAIVLGALAGAATTAALMRDAAPPPSITAIDATRDLKHSVAQLSNELATLKAGIATAQRNANAQFGKLAERLDRTEKAQAEPAAKLAKIQDSLDRLDRRQQQVATTAAPAAADITGSVTPKTDAHPPVADGWRLRDFYAGRAIVQSRNGTLFEVGPGSSLPGLGKVESVKRENGQVVVLTKGGIIAAALDPPHRPGYYLPYRY
jgi:hypothetical protein